MIAGEHGQATALAMRVVTRLAEAIGASRLIDITSAHIDSCLYHGEAGLDFAERLSSAGGQVVVPTTLNVSSLDLLHPQLFRGDEQLAERGRRLMQAYVAMGGQPTFTCAPYQSTRPAQGEHVAWAESNAIVFANSVLGARTARYGDFIDICAAITGRVPEAGLHLDENRRADMVFRIRPLPERLQESEMLYPVVGHLLGRLAGNLLPAIVGLPADAPEDGLKALGAAAASSGGVAMFHAVGRTPEAPTLDVALGGRSPKIEVEVDLGMLRDARNDLSTASEGPLAAVSVGTPHFSLAEFERLAALVDGVRLSVDFFVNTSRDILARAAAAGLVTPLRGAGVEIVTDTCTYITPILRDTSGVVMTNSGKWAYYAPGNLGVDVAFGSLEECVASAVAGEIRRDESMWT
jgi:predicted aconitase